MVLSSQEEERIMMKQDTTKRGNAPMEICPCLLTINDETRILFWVGGKEEKEDHFIKTTNRRVAVAKTSVDIRKLFGSSDRIVIRWDWTMVMFVEAFLHKAYGLRAGRTSTRKTCDYLSSQWNCLDDLAYTLRAPQHLRMFRNPILSRIFDKLFYCIVSIAGVCKRKPYHPKWTKREVKVFGPAMQALWDYIIRVAPEIVGNVPGGKIDT